MNFQLDVAHVALRHSRLRRTILAVSLVLAASNVSAATVLGETVSAATHDKVDFYVAAKATTDSNIFRVANNRQSDTYVTTTVGFNVDKTVSRQRFLAGAYLDLVRYDRFTDLNHVGRNARALWLWQLGNDWSGQLGYAERKALGSFSSIPGRSTNNLKIQRAHGEAAYLLTPSWQLQAGIAEQAQRNSEQNREVNDVDLRTLYLGVNYIFPSSNTVGIGFTQDDGRPVHRQTVGALSFDNTYTQRAVDVHADWAITGKSHLKARLAQVQRDYDELSYRDYDGTTLHMRYDWQATGKLALSVVAQHDISPDEDIQTSFVLIKGVTFRPSYALSEKLKLMATADFSTREYLGDHGLAPGTMTGRSDRVRLLAAAVSYQPTRSVTLLLSGQRETRSSNYQLADFAYVANVLNLSARFTF